MCASEGIDRDSRLLLFNLLFTVGMVWNNSAEIDPSITAKT